MAILGLVVQQADTVTGLRRRLTGHFPHASWSASVAYADLKSLDEQGLICLTETGEKRGDDRYESTPKGTDRFREWLREGSKAPPALHDPTRARLVLCEEEELPDLLPLVRDEQRICAERYDRASWLLKKEKRSAHFGPADDSRQKGLRLALMEDDALIWGYRSLRLKKLIEALEGHDNDVEPLEDDERDG